MIFIFENLNKFYYFRYVAKLNDSKEKPTEAALATPRVSSVLEKMKQKQRQKVKSLPLNRYLYNVTSIRAYGSDDII